MKISTKTISNNFQTFIPKTLVISKFFDNFEHYN